MSEQPVQPATTVQDRLQRALRAAMKAREPAAVAALRSALGAIGNAEALPAPAASARRGGSKYLAGSIEGLGAGEASRRVLSEAETATIIAAEIAERRAAADRYEQSGHGDRADRLRREADALAVAVPCDPA